MEPIKTRSDSRRKLIAASPQEVFAAMSDAKYGIFSTP
jgi:hypothetical protein